MGAQLEQENAEVQKLKEEREKLIKEIADQKASLVKTTSEELKEVELQKKELDELVKEKSIIENELIEAEKEVAQLEGKLEKAENTLVEAACDKEAEGILLQATTSALSAELEKPAEEQANETEVKESASGELRDIANEEVLEAVNEAVSQIDENPEKLIAGQNTPVETASVENVIDQSETIRAEDVERKEEDQAEVVKENVAETKTENVIEEEKAIEEVKAENDEEIVQDKVKTEQPVEEIPEKCLDDATAEAEQKISEAIISESLTEIQQVSDVEGTPREEQAEEENIAEDKPEKSAAEEIVPSAPASETVLPEKEAPEHAEENKEEENEEVKGENSISEVKEEKVDAPVEENKTAADDQVE